MKKPTADQVLRVFAHKDEHNKLWNTFWAHHERNGTRLDVRVGTDGHALAACIEGLDAAALSMDQRFAIVRSEPMNKRELLAQDCPQYWSALGVKPGEGVARMGLDAALFARIAEAQARVVTQTADRIEARKGSFRAEVKKAAGDRAAMNRLLAKGQISQDEVDDYTRWKLDYEGRHDMKAVCELSLSHPMDPLFWSVRSPLESRYYLDEAWVGAVMPCRL